MSNYTPEQVEDQAERVGIVGEDVGKTRAILRAYAATLRQQAGRVDEGMVDAAKRGWMDHIAAHGQGVSFTDRMRAALTAALAQNTQGDGELEDLRRRNTNQAELIRELQHKLGMAVGYPNPTHAERARVPDALPDVQDGEIYMGGMVEPAQVAYHQGWNACRGAMLAAAPSQRAEVK